MTDPTPPTETPAAETPPAPSAPSPAQSAFPGLFDRCRRTAGRYRARPLTFLAIGAAYLIVPALLVFPMMLLGAAGLLAALVSGGAGLIVFAVGGIVAAVAILFFVTFMFTALAATAAFKTGLGASLRTGMHYVLPGVIAYFLFTFAVWTGSLLLFVPGIVLALRFGLYIPVILNERRTGFDALLRSRDLVYGKTLRLFGHMVALTLLLGAIDVAMTFGLGAAIAVAMPQELADTGLPQAIATFVTMLLLLPVGFIYLQLFYEDCVAQEHVEWAPNGKLAKRYRIFAVIGGILFVLVSAGSVLSATAAMLGLAGATDTQTTGDLPMPETEEPVIDPGAERDITRYRDLTAIRVALATYKNGHRSYPDSLDDLVPAQLSTVPADPVTGIPYGYETAGAGYIISFALEKGAFSLAPGEHTLTRNGFDADVGEDVVTPEPETVTVAVSEGTAKEEVPPPSVTGIDADDDGLADDYERSRGLDPLSKDTDRDGIDDGVEIRVTLTDPAKADTDDDGYGDGDEILAGFDPLQAGARLPDLDGDGLANLYEELHDLDGGDADMDNDLLSDGDEIRVFGTDPRVADSDGDGYSDKEELANGFEPLGDGPLTEFRRQEIHDAATQYGTHPPTDPDLSALK